MRRLPALFALLLPALTAFAGEIVVSEGESIHHALRQAREWRRTGDPRCEGGITITLRAGRYYMEEPLFVRPEDSGTAASPTVIQGETGAIVCGDPRQQHTQLWPAKGMERLLGFDTANRTITIATPPPAQLSMLNSQRATLEMVVHQRWAIAILRVKELRVEGDHTVVTFKEPESRLEFEHPWPQPVIDGERGCSSFLLRTTEQRDGIEQLVTVSGAAYVTIQNLTFEHTCWNRPLHKGHVTLQGGFALVDAYKLTENEGLPWDTGLENQAWVERPVSAVSISDAHHVDVIGCTFRHLGATALDYNGITSECTISGNRFEDIGGTAILAGSFAESPREVHRPYGDLAPRCQRLYIADNTISEAATEDWGAVAIGCGYVRDVTIAHNDVRGVNYSGICIGWGWTPLYTGMENNHIVGNRVSDFARQLYDAGGIYTLSNQPGSSIRDNIIGAPANAPYATNDRAFRIYLDARTDGFTIEGNTTGERSITRSDIGDNHPGPNLIVEE
ncbi:MAG: right-handed parallel beta-helix repeat-containing protein [Prevotella sp.]|nr:right-handed parallel beta-helix repeat-containing protein [Prevotella sp.]